MLSFEDNVNRKLDLIWATQMAIVDKDFTQEEMISLLNELTAIDEKYREEVVATGPGVVIPDVNEESSDSTGN
jgi:hypothetical protein